MYATRVQSGNFRTGKKSINFETEIFIFFGKLSNFSDLKKTDV